MSGPDDSPVAEVLPHVERRLAAILSADVKEYSRLMGADEVSTVEMLTVYREAMTALISQHRGRVVDSPGDNLLAEFPSVVDAVQCSVGIQEELNARNADLAGDCRMDFRIGINLGEVIVEGDRIYGDGVNIAARIQGLAEGGGVCVSGSVCDEISGKVPFDCEPLGEQTLKNIDEVVRVYRVRASTPSEAAPGSRSAEAEAEPASCGEPSVAVLPFVSMSEDPEQEHFTDGLTDDIITDLSKIAGLMSSPAIRASSTRTRVPTSAPWAASSACVPCSKDRSAAPAIGCGSRRSSSMPPPAVTSGPSVTIARSPTSSPFRTT
jgi:adenylate cyclase